MKVDFIYFEDWCAMYINGICVYQNHTVNGVTALQVVSEYSRRHPQADLNILEINTHTPAPELEKNVDRIGCAPDSLAECKLLS